MTQETLFFFFTYKPWIYKINLSNSRNNLPKVFNQNYLKTTLYFQFPNRLCKVAADAKTHDNF